MFCETCHPACSMMSEMGMFFSGKWESEQGGIQREMESRKSARPSSIQMRSAFTCSVNMRADFR